MSFINHRGMGRSYMKLIYDGCSQFDAKGNPRTPGFNGWPISAVEWLNKRGQIKDITLNFYTFYDDATHIESQDGNRTLCNQRSSIKMNVAKNKGAINYWEACWTCFEPNRR